MVLISGFVLLCLIVIGVFITVSNENKRQKEVGEFAEKFSKTLVNNPQYFTPIENAEVNQEVESTEKVAEHGAVGHMSLNSTSPSGVNSAIGVKVLSPSDKIKKSYKKDKDKS